MTKLYRRPDVRYNFASHRNQRRSGQATVSEKVFAVGERRLPRRSSTGEFFVGLTSWCHNREMAIWQRRAKGRGRPWSGSGSSDLYF